MPQSSVYKIDRLCLLFYCPNLDEKFNPCYKQTVQKFFSDFESLGSSENYQFHFRTKEENKLDIQLVSSSKKSLKLDDKEIPLSSNGVLVREEFLAVDQEFNLRLEFNPSQGGWHPLKGGSSALISFFLDAQRYPNFDLSNINISRIDHAIDIFENVNLSCVAVPSVRKYSIFGGVDGAETINFGTRRSDTQLTVYNKKKQLHETKGLKTLQEFYYRFEYRNKKGFNFFDETSLSENLFSRVIILGSLKNFVPTSEKRGYQWYHELAQQYLYRIRDVNDLFSLQDALVNVRCLDNSASKRIYNYIQQLIIDSSFFLVYEHPATTFQNQFSKAWDAEKFKIHKYLNLPYRETF